MMDTSTSAHDLGGPLRIGGNAPIIEIPPGQSITDYSLQLLNPGTVLVTRSVPEQGLGGQAVEGAARQFLQRVLFLRHFDEEFNILRDHFIKLFNDARPGVQLGVIAGLALNELIDINGANDQIKSSIIEVPIPLKIIGLDGLKLKVHVRHEDLVPKDMSRVLLEISGVAGGTLTIGRNSFDGTVDIGWKIFKQSGSRSTIFGLNVTEDSISANLQLRF